MTTKDRPTALVTGATSGIGLATARTLAEQGHQVFICARSSSNVELVVKQLRDAGHEVDGLACDVRAGEEVDALVRSAVERFGSLRVLVNNAGRGGGGPVAQIPDEVWDDVLTTNLTSVFRITRAAIRDGGMLTSGGRIINIASTGGKQGVLGASPYSASKAGVIGFTKSIALELAPSGVTVNAVCPGYVETPMAQKVRQNYASYWKTSEDEVMTKFQAKIPLGRYSTPEEVAGLIGYLTSDAAASITGQALNVCGGLGSY